MARWADLEAEAPDLAAAGRALLYQFGAGLSYLATIRPDGGPRLHPVCVNLVDGVLYTLIVDSPKRGDLLRDGRYALHSFPPEGTDDEFYLTGQARHHPDSELRSRVVQAQVESGATTSDDEELFELDIDHALHAKYKPRSEPDNFPPVYSRWRAPRD
jgi:hypothetical protein